MTTAANMGLAGAHFFLSPFFSPRYPKGFALGCFYFSSKGGNDQPKARKHAEAAVSGCTCCTEGTGGGGLCGNAWCLRRVWNATALLAHEVYDSGEDPERAKTLFQRMRSTDFPRKLQNTGSYRCALNLFEWNGVRGGVGESAEAVKLLRFASETFSGEPDANAMRLLAITYAYGMHGLAVDGPIAWALLERAAEYGSADAAFQIGLAYETGHVGKLEMDDLGTIGVATVGDDLKSAIFWYTKAVDMGCRDLDGMELSTAHNMGVAYMYGTDGAEQSADKAVRCFLLAADQELPEAQSALGKMYSSGMYSKGEGEQQDHEEAARWFHKAAHQGFAEAQLALGAIYSSCMYSKSEGEQQNHEEAVRWFHKAAHQGLADAQWHLGIAYNNGRGAEQNFKEAADWTLKAAVQGHAGAMFNMGFNYNHGAGVEEDHGEAARRFRKVGQCEDDLGLKAQAQSELDGISRVISGVGGEAEEGCRSGEGHSTLMGDDQEEEGEGCLDQESEKERGDKEKGEKRPMRGD